MKKRGTETSDSRVDPTACPVLKDRSLPAWVSVDRRKMMEAGIRNPNPDVLLRLIGEMLADNGNPYYAWTAVDVCIKHGTEFPEWLFAYLGECAERMLSDEAKKEGRDLRKALPWIFGFPNVLDPTQRKRGPGNMLDPEGDPDRMKFAFKFAIRLERGQQPAAAMSDACNDVFDGKNDSADEKTLRRWLLKEFDLKKSPKSAEEWKKVAREHFSSIAEDLVAMGQSRAKL
jgi:hypothetical protein